MRYTVDLAASVKAYLRNLTSLSRQGRIKVFANLDNDLRTHGDALRENAALRAAPGSPTFVWDLMVRDQNGDNQLHYFQFIVNDAAAEYGVLRVVYVEEIAD